MLETTKLMVVVTIIGSFAVVAGTMGTFANQVIAQEMSSNETMMMEGGNMTKEGMMMGDNMAK